MNTFAFPVPLRIIHALVSPNMVGWNVKGLSAPFWRFYWNDRGNNFAHLFGKRVELVPESCYVIPAETPFDAESQGAVNHFHIHFMMGIPYHRPAPAIHRLGMDGDLGNLVHTAAALLTGVNEESRDRLALIVQAILLTALARLDSIRPYPGADTPRLRRVLDLLSGMGSTVSNAACAQEAGMSTNAFIRWFRLCTATTPQEYRLGCQIDLACERLIYSDLSIEQIAQETGFCDRHYFSRVFKRFRSESPAAFRKSLRSVGRK